MKRNTVNYIVDLLAGISFLVLITTAIIKFPGLLSSLGVGRGHLPMYQISLVHDWSGAAFAVLIAIHFLLHWRWVVFTTRSFFRKRG